MRQHGPKHRYPDRPVQRFRSPSRGTLRGLTPASQGATAVRRLGMPRPARAA